MNGDLPGAKFIGLITVVVHVFSEDFLAFLASQDNLH
jgi:hypothetical protein